MRRREFLAVLGAAASPAIVLGQPMPRKPLVGILRVNPPDPKLETFVNPFRRAMASLGWEEGRTIEYRIAYAGGNTARLPALADELVAAAPNVIVAFGNPATRVLAQRTAVIPIVGMSEDFVGQGLATSVARPGRNVTGVTIMATELDPKRLEVLSEALPGARRIALLSDPEASPRVELFKAAARALGLDLSVLPVGTAAALQRALDELRKTPVDAVIVASSPVLNAARHRLVTAFAEARLPAIFQWPETAREGGLMAYGPSIAIPYDRIPFLVDKILRGATPGDMPIEQPTKFELVINLKTAKALGLAIPPTLLARADEVIE